MQFFIYGSPSERQQPRDAAELGKFMEESAKKGILITGGGLHRNETRIPAARSSAMPVEMHF